jgi:hypothetical protein
MVAICCPFPFWLFDLTITKASVLAAHQWRTDLQGRRQNATTLETKSSFSVLLSLLFLIKKALYKVFLLDLAP